ncbi:MAG: HEAT repeat domain-containing protein [Flavobacteriaceae bacterium]|jgi:hypothetical protein|nr:HEAT repeat domain-containing protein [Flavobacteriaceae bacterium]
MKIPVLVDLQQEVNRLYIAGSKFAPNDPRLKKLVPTLDAMAQKAAVFKKLSENVTTLIESNEQESAQHLFEVGNLLYAILYTQAEQKIESTTEQKELTPLVSLNNSSTRLKFSQLKPVIEALSQSNPGRYEIIREAFENKLLIDSRFYPYVAKAVNDKYADLSFYIIHTVIPAIGTPIVPFMLNQVTYEDNSSNIKTVEALYNAGYPQLLEILDKIVENEDTTKLLGTALSLYKAFPVREEVLYKYTTNKNAAVREGAFHALAQLNTEKSIEHLLHLLETKKTDKYQDAILTELGQIETKKHFLTEIFNIVKQRVDEVISNIKDKKTSNSSYSYHSLLRLPLTLIDGDSSDRSINFLFETAITILKDYKSFNYQITHILDTIDSLPLEKRKKLYDDIMSTIKDKPYFTPKNSPLERFVEKYFIVCIDTMVDADTLYNNFNPLLSNNLLAISSFERVLNLDSSKYTKAEDSYQLSSKWDSLLLKQLAPDLQSKHLYRRNTSFVMMIYIMIYFKHSVKEIETFIKDNSTIELYDHRKQYFEEYKAAN